jgi:flagellar motor switch protein FliM
MGLTAGDLLCLETPLDKPVDVLINGARRLSGRLADGGRKRAIRIHDVLHPGESAPR